MTRDSQLYYEDVLQSIDKIRQYTAGCTLDQGQSNPQLQDAVIHRLEIIGEAVKHIPPEERAKHPYIPWRNIAGMRDVLVHEYFGMNVTRVWAILGKDLSSLYEAVRALSSPA